MAVSNGRAQKQFTFDIDCAGDGAGVSTNHLPYSNAAQGTCLIDFKVAGFDLGRSGGMRPSQMHRDDGHFGSLSGGKSSGSTDPTYTRWLPLAFSPLINSQPFRYQAGALPAPWGNINCVYSMSLRQEPPTQNYDLDGTASEYIPSFDPSIPGFYLLKPLNTPMYSLTDANGDRLLFGVGMGPYSDVHSVFSSDGNGRYYLSSAGPPGAMKQKGDYTYTFWQTSAQNAPLTARLFSIKDDLGNEQRIGYNAGGFMVTDVTSGRVLSFTTDANGYVTGVDAPESEANNGIHTHTALTWDGNGHCTAINVYAPTTNTLLHSDTFQYGGPNGDSVVSEQQGVGTS